MWGAVSFGPGGVSCENRPHSAEAAVFSVRDWIGQNAGAECNARGNTEQEQDTPKEKEEEKEKSGKGKGN